MSLLPTSIILLAALLVAVFANWQERRPRAVGRPPLLSYPAIQMIALVVLILMAAHLLSLLTDQPFVGRMQGTIQGSNHRP